MAQIIYNTRKTKKKIIFIHFQSHLRSTESSRAYINKAIDGFVIAWPYIPYTCQILPSQECGLI